MSLKQRSFLMAAGLALLLLFFAWEKFYRPGQTPGPVPGAPLVQSTMPAAGVPQVVVLPAAPTGATTSSPTITSVPPVKESPKKKALPPVAPAPASNPMVPVPPPPAVKLHKELIPKDITIVRCYYSQEIVSPGTTFEFDINGSGFTEAFEQMIQVDPGSKDVSVKNLRLMTANQIRGEMTVNAKTPTAFIYPKVLIKNLPVFSAPDPFAVVRVGEVITIFFTDMGKEGRSGRFRVITHLTQEMAKTFRVAASSPGLTVSDIEAHLPYVVEGVLRIEGAPQGEYSLVAYLGEKEIFRRPGMIRIVQPQLGQSGLIQRVIAVDRFRRPGDTVQFYLQGTGYAPDDVKALTAQVPGLEVLQASFTYVSPSQIQLSFTISPQAEEKEYSVSILGPANQVLREEKDAFEIVPPLWIAGVQVIPPISSGGKSTLRLVGRDFTPDFASGLAMETDEPGIAISSPTLSNPGLLTCDIAIKDDVRPGDYWVHLRYKGKTLKPEFGSIFKVNPK